MLLEHEPQACVSTAFSSSQKQTTHKSMFNVQVPIQAKKYLAGTKSVTRS